MNVCLLSRGGSLQATTQLIVVIWPRQLLGYGHGREEEVDRGGADRGGQDDKHGHGKRRLAIGCKN